MEQRPKPERPHQHAETHGVGQAPVVVVRLRVVGERELLAPVAGADPHVPVPAERDPRPVRGGDLEGTGLLLVDAGAGPRAVRPLPAGLERGEPRHVGVAVGDLEVECRDRQVVRLDGTARRLGQRRREPVVVERVAAGALGRVDHDVAGSDAVPEAGTVVQPLRRDGAPGDVPGSIRGKHLLGTGVLGGGDHMVLLHTL